MNECPFTCKKLFYFIAKHADDFKNHCKCEEAWIHIHSPKRQKCNAWSDGVLSRLHER